MTARAQHDLDLANNLIETLGAQRAMHVAIQFAWYGVADEISMLAKRTAEISGQSGPDTGLAGIRWVRPADYGC